MKEKETKKDEVIEIDFKRLPDAVVHKAWLVEIDAILCKVLTFLGTFFFVTPMYESSAIFYVNNNALSVGPKSLGMGYNGVTDSGKVYGKKYYKKYYADGSAQHRNRQSPKA